jgi:hypothetical protein
MNEFMDSYFGPLGKEWCLYFYVLSIFFFVAYILAIIGVIGGFVMKRKKIDALFVANGMALIFNTLLAYFVNRLLNTMCINSTH